MVIGSWFMVSGLWLGDASFDSLHDSFTFRDVSFLDLRFASRSLAIRVFVSALALYESSSSWMRF